MTHASTCGQCRETPSLQSFFFRLHIGIATTAPITPGRHSVNEFLLYKMHCRVCREVGEAGHRRTTVIHYETQQRHSVEENEGCVVLTLCCLSRAGVSCAGTDPDHVVSLIIEDTAVSGELPPAIGALPWLTCVLRGMGRFVNTPNFLNHNRLQAGKCVSPCSCVCARAQVPVL